MTKQIGELPRRKMPEYRAYGAARSRCTNPNVRNYNRYGGRGIEFKFKTFEEFYAHIGPRPSAKLSLDRIDNNGHYEKGNIYWATASQQALNRSKVFRTAPRSDTKSGVPGVCRHKDGKWRAYITINGKQKGLGCFEEIDLAIAARKQSLENITDSSFVIY